MSEEQQQADNIEVETQESFHKPVVDENVEKAGGKVKEETEESALEEQEEEQEDPEASEEEEESEDESVEGEEPEEGESEDGEKKEKKPKKKGGFQRRINKLTKQKSAAEQRAQYLEQRLKDLEERVESRAPDKDKVQEETPGKPMADDFEYHDEYVEALTDWKLEQKFSKKSEEEKANQMKTQYQKQMDEHLTRVRSFAKDHEDFEEVIDDVSDVVVSPAVEQLIVESDNGPELLYELAKDRELFESINALDLVAAARQIGKIEASLHKPEAETKKRGTTKAPKPLKSVSTKSSGAKKSIYDPGLSQKEYERLRMEQMNG